MPEVEPIHPRFSEMCLRSDTYPNMLFEQHVFKHNSFVAPSDAIDIEEQDSCEGYSGHLDGRFLVKLLAEVCVFVLRGVCGMW